MGFRKGETTPLGNPVAFDGGLVEIGARTWAWVQPNGGLGESNAGLVVGDGEALLVDTLWDENLTRAMLAEVEPVLAEAGATITRVFNTHGDGDHWYGNGVLDASVAITASEPAVEQMRGEPPSMLTRMAPIGIAAERLGRLPVPGAERVRGLGSFNSMLSNYDFRGADPRVPGDSFADSVTLEVGGRRIELEHVGPAHTAGDSIAWLPDARICFAGDILFSHLTPIMWAGPVGNFIAALDRIEALEPQVVVGGHGPVGGLDEVRALRDYWLLLRERVRAAGPDTDPMDLAMEIVDSPDYEAYREWDAAERNCVNVARIAATEAGGPTEIGTAERLRLISGMGALGERLLRRASGG